MCGCGNAIPAPRVQAVLSVDEVQVERPFSRPLKDMGMVALIGLDIIGRYDFRYASGRFTLEGK